MQPSWIRTQPSPVPDASQYTSKDIVMSGCTNTGVQTSSGFETLHHALHSRQISPLSLRRYHVTQELNFGQPELTLAELRIQLMITQSLKCNAEMLFMLFLTLRKDQDVINEDHGKLV
jgi:hypothetical protein